MGDFRIPHPFENIGDAIKDAVNAAVNTATPTGATDVVTQLMNENNRAIEDAIDGGTTRGAILADEETGVPSNTPVSFQWVIPGRSQNVFSGFVTAETSIPAGQSSTWSYKGPSIPR